MSVRNGWKELEIWVAVDRDGDYEVGTTREDATDRFDDNLGGEEDRRMVKIVLQVELPKDKTAVELTGEAPLLPVATGGAKLVVAK